MEWLLDQAALISDAAVRRNRGWDRIKSELVKWPALCKEAAVAPEPALSNAAQNG
jgi:hypothetical protein